MWKEKLTIVISSIAIFISSVTFAINFMIYSKKSEEFIDKQRKYFGEVTFLMPKEWKWSVSDLQQLLLIPKEHNKSSKIRLIPVGNIEENSERNSENWFEQLLFNELKDKEIVVANLDQCVLTGSLEKSSYPLVSKEFLLRERNGKLVYNCYFFVNPPSSTKQAYLIVLSSEDRQEYLDYKYNFLQLVYSLDFLNLN